ncbi:hypothetical protein ACWGE0_35065 [Lentzea sp. NPDC054927]
MKLLKRAAAMACAVAAVVVMAPGANAAVSYWYRPSHPMNYTALPLGQTYCTGGWGVRSNLNNVGYFLAAGSCFSAGQDVYGTSGRFGVVAKSDYSAGFDSALVAPLPDVDGLQEIPDLGRTVGKMSNEWSTTRNNAIAMQSPRGGRVYGVIAGGWWSAGPDDSRLACANFPNAPGSAGAPVFVHNANGVYAAGVSVGSAGTSFTCFVTIDDLLAHWKVWLPVFSSAAKTGAPDLQLQADLSGPAEKLPVQPLPGPIVR